MPKSTNDLTISDMTFLQEIITSGPVSATEYAKTVPGLKRANVTTRLIKLESLGLLQSRYGTGGGPDGRRVYYGSTSKGEALADAWAAKAASYLETRPA